MEQQPPPLQEIRESESVTVRDAADDNGIIDPRLRTTTATATATTNTATTNTINTTARRRRNRLGGEHSLFFLAGVGSSLGYIATLSSLVYLTLIFEKNPNVFVYINCAVYLPTGPIR